MSDDTAPNADDTAPADDPLVATEQVVIDHAYACLDAMVDRATAAREITDRAVRDENTADARVAQWHLRKREAELVAGAGPLSFGRIDEEPLRPGVAADHWYVGRRHVEDEAGEPVVVDWRAPVSAPFYRATSIDPCGLTSRRRFSLDGRTLVAVSDEDLTDPDGESHGGLPDPLLAELERARSGQMRDIVSTIAAEQDEIIRAELDELLIVQGGPGTGKTAVGLHRAAFLLFQHRHHLEDRKVLVVGPNPLFLRYIAEVLPSLGESAVVQATVPGLMAARYPVRAVDDDATASVKGSRRMVDVVDRFLAAKITVPTDGMEIRAGITVVRFDAADIDELQQKALARKLPLNSARDTFRQLIIQEGWRRHSERPGVEPGGQPQFASAVNRDPQFKKDFDRCWPAFSAPVVVREMYSSKRKLAAAAKGILEPDELVLLARSATKKATDERWTTADLGVIDEVVDRTTGVPTTYGHVVVDEAQDHSAMNLRLLARRAERGSMTILGDLAQATSPVALRSWERSIEALVEQRGDANARVVELTVGYRVPAAILDLANRLLATAAPEITPTRSIRPGGTEPMIVSASADELGERVVEQVDALREQTETLAVVAVGAALDTVEAALAAAGIPHDRVGRGSLPGAAAVAIIDPDAVKGLEFDAVIVVEPAAIAELDAGLLRLYVAMTRPVQHLAIVHARPLPAELVDK